MSCGVNRPHRRAPRPWYIAPIVATEPDFHLVASILRRHLPSEDWRAYLFGSRARGDARPGSDWDIGLLGPAPLPGAILERIRADLEELRTLHTFDVVDMTAAEPGFREAALRSARPVV